MVIRNGLIVQRRGEVGVCGGERYQTFTILQYSQYLTKKIQYLYDVAWEVDVLCRNKRVQIDKHEGHTRSCQSYCNYTLFKCQI